MNKIKKIISLLLSAVIVMTLASCTYNFEAQIKEDGKVEVYNKFTFSEEKLDSFYTLFQDNFTVTGLEGGLSNFPKSKQEFIDQSDENGLTEIKDDVKYYTYQELSEDINDIKTLESNLLMLGTGEITTTDFWIYSVSSDNSWFVDVDEILAEVSESGIDATYGYVLKMPYKIEKTNATKVDDYTVSFSYNDKKVYATTEKSTAAWTKADDVEKQVINLAKSKLTPKKTSLTVAYKNKKSVAVEWSSEDYLASFNLQRKVGSGKWTTLKNLNDFAYTDKSVKAGKKYYYRVRGYVKTDDFTVYGAYSKTKSLNFANFTSKPSISVKKGSKKATVTIKKFDKTVKGYQIQYSTNKKFKKSSKVYTTKSKKVIKKLKSGKKYYFRVRKYCRDIDGDKFYGAYSKTKSVKIK